MNWFKFLNKIKPDGKAFRAIEWTKTLFEVIADGLQDVIDYADLHINDQVWYVNDNFDPEPWEDRYNITPSPFATLEQRREIVRSYMLYPQSANRLSLDYIQEEMDNAGFTGVVVEYNSTGDSEGYLHVNSSFDEKSSFSLGSLTYNSFILSGSISGVFFEQAIKLALSLKPLQVDFYNKMEVFYAIAIDDSLAWAIDDSLATALTTV
jgi:hypothetical protein